MFTSDPSTLVSSIELEEVGKSSPLRLPGLGWLLWAFIAVFTLSLTFGIRLFVFETFKIPSGSMTPTLLEGDFILVNKMHYGSGLRSIFGAAYNFDMPKIGDIVVFKHPDNNLKSGDGYYIKRIVAGPGDYIEIRNFHVYRNEELVTDDVEFYLPNGLKMVDPKLVSLPPQQLLEGQYFVLGDNRTNSEDSRIYGPIDLSMIEGRAALVYWSSHEDNTGFHIRWDRIAKRIS